MNMRADLSASTGDDAPPKLLERRAERLVVAGFRCWLAGYEHGSVECWEVAWKEFACELGSSGARSLIGDLQYWIRTIRSASCREIAWFPYGCRYVCHDECMVLSQISSLQHGKRGQACAAIHHLTGATASSAIETVLEAGSSFANSLLANGCRLAPVSEHIIAEIAERNSETRPTH